MSIIRNRLLQPSLLLLTLISSFFIPVIVLAHHSFAIFDFETQIPFEGTVESVKFRNPHIAMTLKTVDENGNEKIIDFIEGAPANMLVRTGLRPQMIAPGTHLTIVGSPLIEDNSKFFIRIIRLDSGEEF